MRIALAGFVTSTVLFSDHDVNLSLTLKQALFPLNRVILSPKSTVFCNPNIT